MDYRELEPKDERGPWLWVALGCGGLALMGLCLAPAVGWFLFASDDEPDVVAPTPGGPEPWGGPGPGPNPGPGPGPNPGPGPGQGPGTGVPAPPSVRGTDPRHVTATVESVSGLSSVAAGATCELDVERHDRGDGTFWCRAQIRCAGELLYGGGSAGYFDCTLYDEPHRHVVGEDFNTARGDGDAAMRLDTLRHELEVRDDPSGRLGAFEVRARVTDVR